MQTEVIFQAKSKGKGNIYCTRSDGHTIRFNNGVYKTSSRKDINYLLNSDLMSRNLISCVTPMEHVDKWLRGETPDKLTDELLSTISEEGLREIARVLGLNERRHGNHGAVIKSIVKGKPISNAISFIIEKYKVEDEENEVKDWLKLATEGGLVYRSGPWYKYMKGDEPDSNDDLTLGKVEEKAQQWCIDNQKEIEERLTKDA